MQVYGPAHLHGPQAISAPHSARATQPTAPTESSQSSPIRDEVQISDAAQMIEKTQSMPDVRQDRVSAIRAQIAQGTYETSDKLNVAVSRLLDEIG
jgi:negative regulator of flagellin synthesis FlgM